MLVPVLWLLTVYTACVSALTLYAMSGPEPPYVGPFLLAIVGWILWVLVWLATGPITAAERRRRGSRWVTRGRFVLLGFMLATAIACFGDWLPAARLYLSWPFMARAARAALAARSYRPQLSSQRIGLLDPTWLEVHGNAVYFTFDMPDTTTRSYGYIYSPSGRPEEWGHPYMSIGGPWYRWSHTYGPDGIGND